MYPRYRYGACTVRMSFPLYSFSLLFLGGSKREVPFFLSFSFIPFSHPCFSLLRTVYQIAFHKAVESRSDLASIIRCLLAWALSSIPSSSSSSSRPGKSVVMCTSQRNTNTITPRRRTGFMLVHGARRRDQGGMQVPLLWLPSFGMVCLIDTTPPP